MNKKDKKLIVLIDEFFQDKTVAQRKRSPVWKVLRERLTETGNWKNAPRGNPKKGFIKSDGFGGRRDVASDDRGAE